MTARPVLPCPACGVEPVSRVLDVPHRLVPEMGRLAVDVNRYVAAGEDLAVIADLRVERAAAVMLIVETLRKSCPPGVEFAAWVGAFLLSWELDDAARGRGSESP